MGHTKKLFNEIREAEFISCPNCNYQFQYNTPKEAPEEKINYDDYPTLQKKKTFNIKDKWRIMANRLGISDSQLFREFKFMEFQKTKYKYIGYERKK